MSDDTPTQRFEQPVSTGPTPTDEPEKKSKALLITLISVGGVLLIAIIVLLVLLFGRTEATPIVTPSPTPSSTATASATPTPTPTKTATTAPTTPPDPEAPVVNTFTVSTTQVTCPPLTTDPQPQLTFSWTSDNASAAFFGVDVSNAQQNPYYSDLPPNGDTTDFGEGPTFTYSCSQSSHTYVITVVGSGQSASKSITVTRN